MKRKLQYPLIALALGLWLVPQLALAADVPIIGISTGDANRGPLVDYIQAMLGVRVPTPGYDLIPPQKTATMADEAATKARPQESIDREVERDLIAAQDFIAEQEWLDAQEAARAALKGIERDGGEKGSSSASKTPGSRPA